MNKQKYLNLKNKFQKGSLENGLKYICSPNSFHHKCSIVMLVRVGSRNETPKEYGLAHYLEHMLFKGNRTYPKYLQLNKKIDSLQGETNASTHKNMTMYYLKLPGKNFKEGLALMREMVFFSLLDAVELEKEKKVVIEEINKNTDESIYWAHDLLETKLFGSHQLAHFILGTKKNIRDMTRKQLMKFYQKYYQVDNCVLALSGNIPKNYQSIIQETMGMLEPNPQAIKWNWQDVKINYRKPQILCHHRKQEQISIVLGFPTIKETDDRKYMLEMISQILYGNMSSRLWLKLRDNNPIVYGIDIYVELFEEGGYFSIDLSLSKKNLEKTLDILFEELTQMKNKVVAKKEFELVREKMISDLEEEDEDNLEVASHYGEKYLLDLELTTFAQTKKIYQEMKSSQVKKMCQEVFDFNKCTLIEVGDVPKKKVEMLVKKYFVS